MLYVAVCEDDVGQREHIVSLLTECRQRYPQADIQWDLFDSGSQMLESPNSLKYQLYLLDIFMPGITGLDCARILRDKGCTGPIVFLTAAQEFALEAYRVEALQYLVKPLDSQAFFRTIDFVIQIHQRSVGRVLPINTPEGLVQLQYNNICYVECIRHVVEVHMADGSQINSRSLRISFGRAMEPLLEDSRFIQPHKSFVLNMAKVEVLGVDFFGMPNGARIPIPKSKLGSVRSAYLSYLSGASGGPPLLFPWK